MKQDQYTPKPYSKVRVRNRAHYDRETIFSILDAGLVAHVGFVLDERPMVIPMIYARSGETLYIHGAKASRIIKKPAEQAPACLTVTHVDGIVVARSAFHHSMNYRSVVVHGHVHALSDADEKQQALIALTNHSLPGRWDEVRPMTDKEFRATGVLAFDIETASAKIRQGPPIDEEEDYALPIWAGVLPTHQVAASLEPDPRNLEGIEPPESVRMAIKQFS